jgi:hypothetical protein
MNDFNIGDKVKVTILPQGSEGTIVAIHHRFYVVEFIDQSGDTYTYSYEKHELIRTESLISCQCGAVYTWAPDQHAFWCPKWSKQ